MNSNTFDTILENGTIYDGTGGDSFVADVGILNDKIEHIGQLQDAETANRINITGLAVSVYFPQSPDAVESPFFKEYFANSRR